MYGTGKSSFNLRLLCFIVGACHLIIVGLSVYERIWELIKLEEPFLIQEHIFILTSYIVQIAATCLLIFGSVTGNTYCIMPWLICTAPVFISATTYAILYSTREEASQIFLNFLIIGVIWSTWYFVAKFHLENKRSKPKLMP